MAAKLTQTINFLIKAVSIKVNNNYRFSLYTEMKVHYDKYLFK